MMIINEIAKGRQPDVTTISSKKLIQGFWKRSTSLTSLSKFMDDEPLIPVVASAFDFHSIAFLFISLPFSPSINSITSFSTSSLFASLSISMPTPQSTQANLQLVCCSEKKGQHSIGTPLDKLSMVEFHPMWLKNPHIDECFRTFSCAHQLAIRPLSLVSSRNSGGKTANSALTRSGLIIHKTADSFQQHSLSAQHD